MRKLSILIACCFVSFNIISAADRISKVEGNLNSQEDFRVASLFKDHMVLQRGMPVPVWGNAAAGAIVTIDFADLKFKKVVGTDGKWSLKLNSLSASFEPKVMTITSSKNQNEIVIADIVIGDVWICSGQSNMQFGINGAPEVKALFPSAKNIRSFTVQNTVAFEPQDSCDGEWISEQPNSAVAFAFAYFLEKEVNVPIGIIMASWGSSSLEAWMPRELTASVPHFKVMMEEFDDDKVTQSKIKKILAASKPWTKEDDIFLRRQTNILFNAMMNPLIPYACSGLAWYQGERNAQSMHGMVKEPWYSRNSGILAYGNTLKEWVKMYRNLWDRENMQFQIVMLPGYEGVLDSGPSKNSNNPNAHSWAWMRESQLEVLDLPHTSVVNTIDLGDAKNIHPTDKLPIGERLALLARANVLKEKIEAYGPVYRKVKNEGNTLVVHFDHVNQLKTIDGKAPREFWLSDESNKWVQGQAIIKGKTIEISSSEIAKPVYIRYAFTGKPDVNLVNEENLPAYPFRTDEFKP
ncbi:sialate O-acetylesterase [Flavobacterium algicola]|uniref:sialate O-acetylesterase n=1 Tax=Flavobacterium algicola TaxID=556529 RepID=UPI001EFE5E91|nr:sialate O-acetylesterase [Flavobacterium algicola]MCG9792279.1 hypothetical protein [Flavobacterium algicola]